MNKKLERTIADIDKTNATIAQYQAKLRELEQQKTALENAEIVALFRKERLTEDDFRAYIQSRREADTATAAPAPEITTKETPADD